MCECCRVAYTLAPNNEIALLVYVNNRRNDAAHLAGQAVFLKMNHEAGGISTTSSPLSRSSRASRAESLTIQPCTTYDSSSLLYNVGELVGVESLPRNLSFMISHPSVVLRDVAGEALSIGRIEQHVIDASQDVG